MVNRALRWSCCFIVMLSIVGIHVAAQNLEIDRQVAIQEHVHAGKRFLRLLTGEQKSEFRPHGIVALNQDRMGVTDLQSGRFLVLDATGTVQASIGPDKPGRFGAPVGVCAVDGNTVFLVDSEESTLYRLDLATGTAFLIMQTATGRLTDVTELNGHLWCTDTDRHCIVQFNRSGEKILEKGERGSGPLQFNFPTAIASDGRHLFILDTLNFRIQVLTPTGEYVRTIGSHGGGGGQFSKPKGLAVDGSGHLYVSDVSFDNIQVFDATGRYLDHVGSSGSGQLEFWMPAGLAVTKRNEILVADTFNGRIQILRVTGVPQ